MAAHQPLIDLRTAAEHLGLSTRTLRRMVEREEVPYRRIGRALRFNLALMAPRTWNARLAESYLSRPNAFAEARDLHDTPGLRPARRRPAFILAVFNFGDASTTTTIDLGRVGLAGPDGRPSGATSRPSGAGGDRAQNSTRLDAYF
jgi:excisionase family DNA binding protein